MVPLWMIVAYIVISAFVIFSIQKLNARKNEHYKKAALSSFIAYTFLFLFVWISKLPVPSYLIFLSMLMSFLSCYFGQYRLLYLRSRVFDRYVHALGAFTFSLLTYSFVRLFTSAGGSKLFQALFIFFTGMAIGAIFELAEAVHDVKNKHDVKDQKGLKDTNMDILFNLFGSCVSAVFAYYAFI